MRPKPPCPLGHMDKILRDLSTISIAGRTRPLRTAYGDNMFGTYLKTRLPISGLTDDIAAWPFVFPETYREWFFVEQLYRNELDPSLILKRPFHVQDIEHLKWVIKSQNDYEWVKEIYIATPPEINKSSIWKFDPIECIIEHQHFKQYEYTYKVANSKNAYTTTSKALNMPSVTIFENAKH